MSDIQEELVADPTRIVFSLPIEIWENALGEAIREALGRSPALQEEVDRQVMATVKEQIKGHPMIEFINGEVSSYLARYPELWTNPELQAEVGRFILNKLQGGAPWEKSGV